VGLNFLSQGDLHRMSSGVCGVDYAAMAVSAFAREVESCLVGLVAAKGHALLEQPINAGLAVFDHVAGRSFIA
jgi:hypothetical protein